MDVFENINNFRWLELFQEGLILSPNIFKAFCLGIGIIESYNGLACKGP